MLPFLAPLAPYIAPTIATVISLVVLKETKKGNHYALWGIIVGVLSTIALVYAFSPEKEIKYDVKNYYDDGSTLRFVGNGTLEDKEGAWKWYSEDGILIKFATYDDNELDGEYKEFYKNGNLKIQGEYDDGGKEANKWKCFNLDGSAKKCLEN